MPTIMDPNLSAKHSRDSVINSEYKCIIKNILSSCQRLAEVFNKTIEKLLKKFVSKIQHDWDDKLGKCLWAYRTTVRTKTKAIPFFLVYGCEAVLPLEI